MYLELLVIYYEIKYSVNDQHGLLFTVNQENIIVQLILEIYCIIFSL